MRRGHNAKRPAPTSETEMRAKVTAGTTLSDGSGAGSSSIDGSVEPDRHGYRRGGGRCLRFCPRHSSHNYALIPPRDSAHYGHQRSSTLDQVSDRFPGSPKAGFCELHSNTIAATPAAQVAGINIVMSQCYRVPLNVPYSNR
jgi:hypothetical protein